MELSVKEWFRINSILVDLGSKPVGTFSFAVSLQIARYIRCLEGELEPIREYGNKKARELDLVQPISDDLEGSERAAAIARREAGMAVFNKWQEEKVLNQTIEIKLPKLTAEVLDGLSITQLAFLESLIETE